MRLLMKLKINKNFENQKLNQWSLPFFSPLYFVKRGISLIYSVLRPLFAEQRGDGGEFINNGEEDE